MKFCKYIYRFHTWKKTFIIVKQTLPISQSLYNNIVSFDKEMSYAVGERIMCIVKWGFW